MSGPAAATAARDAQGIAIPRTLDDVTPAWLEAALAKRFPSVSIASARIDGFHGYKPNKARIHLTYDGPQPADLPPTMLVKGSFKADPDAPRSGLDVGNVLELSVYVELVPLLDVTTPDCFFVTVDTDRYEGVMLMADIEAEGATFLKHAISLDYSQAARFIDALARLHAPMLDSPEFAAGGRFGPASGLGERSRMLNEQYIDRLVEPDYWDTFIALPRGMALPNILRDAGRMAAAFARMKTVHQGVARVIIHGDAHLGNLYLTADGRPGFYDWCSRIEPWVNDFTYLLLSNVDSLDRRAWERPMLARYLAGLERAGATPPTFDEAWFLYRCTTIFPFLTWLNNSSKWQPEAINTMNTVRAATAVIDHDAFGLLGA